LGNFPSFVIFNFHQYELCYISLIPSVGAMFHNMVSKLIWYLHLKGYFPLHFLWENLIFSISILSFLFPIIFMSFSIFLGKYNYRDYFLFNYCLFLVQLINFLIYYRYYFLRKCWVTTLSKISIQSFNNINFKLLPSWTKMSSTSTKWIVILKIITIYNRYVITILNVLWW